MMFDKVKEILRKYTEVESITEDLSLTKDLMLTSLDVVSMVGDFEDAFDIEIVDEEVMQLKTVGDILEYLKNKGIE
jgi:acyl carrier protein